MSLDKMQQLVNSLDDNEELSIPILTTKLARYVDNYPEDKTLGAVSRVIEKMASNNNFFIRRAEFKSLYNKMYTNNTKFAELFQDELGRGEEKPSIKIYERDDSSELDPYKAGDSVLANALSSVFSGGPLKMYSQDLAEKAVKSVSSALSAWNLKPSSIKVDDGNENFILIRASYETPKGVTSFFVPVEVSDNKVAEAAIFVGNSGAQDLNNKNIKAYLRSNTGVKLGCTASSILDLLNRKNSDREIDDVELALIKLNTSRKNKTEFSQNQIVGQKLAEASIKDVELPKSNEFESFEKNFNSAHGIAGFEFGEDKVRIGRDHISRELSSYGHKNVQVVVTGSNKETIFYGVSLDAGRVGFTVPVKVANGKLSKPSYILCNGEINSFDQNGINQLYINNQSDFKVAAAASPLYGLKPSELISNIKEALFEGNAAKAEDALNVLGNTNDENAYAMGFQIFLKGLSNKIAKTDECNMMIKNSTSEHPICGHTGLPVHKTYKDKDGNCRPLYRRGMEEGYEGAIFMNHKIFG